MPNSNKQLITTFEERYRRRNISRGDFVIDKLSSAAAYYSANLAPKYIGPYKIHKVPSILSYDLIDELGKIKPGFTSTTYSPIILLTSNVYLCR